MMKRRQSSTRILQAISVALLVAGCNTLPHKTAQMKAEQRWSHVRGRVKFQLAEQQYEGGLFSEAIHTVTESLSLDPTQADAYALLAQANLELGKPASAQEALDAASSAGLRTADLVYTRGVILEQRGEADKAVPFYAEARRLEPKNVDFLVAYAECLVAVDRASEALTILDASIGRLDDAGTVAALAGHVAALLGDMEGAIRRYRSAMVPGADSDVLSEDLGLLLVRAGRYTDAPPILEPLIAKAKDPSLHGAVRRALAKCYLAFGDAAKAEGVLTPYATAHADDVAAQVLLVKAAIGADDMVTALAALNQAELRAPHHSEVQFVRAVVEWKRGKLNAATKALYNVLTSSPDDIEAHCLMAEVLLEQHKRAAARNHFEKALSIDPQCAWAAAGLKSMG